jgi:hypothetical protein
MKDYSWVSVVASVVCVGTLFFVAPETVAWIGLAIAALGWIAWAIWGRERRP